MKLDGARIRDARDRMGVTQEKMAESTGLSAPTIVRAEQGKDVFATTGRLICEYLRLDLAEVVVPRQKRRRDGDAA